jgi:hypothetical protein
MNKLYLLICCNCCDVSVHHAPAPSCFQFKCAHCGYDDCVEFRIDAELVTAPKHNRERLDTYRAVEEGKKREKVLVFGNEEQIKEYLKSQME